MNETKPTNATNATIRPLNEEDAEAFQSMRLRAAENDPQGIASTVHEIAQLTRAQNEARIRVTGEQIVFAAFDGDALVGIVGLLREVRQKLAHKALIWGVFVDPARRGGGIAKKLMESAVNHARSIGVLQVQLVVSAQNPRAQALYRSCGFVRYGVEPRGLCVNGEYIDDELMVLFLDDPAVPD
ncbi:GNAT family N-acetyltransferase [Paraburkholderia acidiphila]|uniref:GNAT family N-acetyltransferase n=2 Tax=Paraburkholderia acidiphila TaxID=2571747 RepID=A0A7Z2JAP7_9BURK|nr:GNAT family N-acetyltransferase [Paraburkholderia acidiphila]